MQGWIRDIEMKIQDFRGPSKVTLTVVSPFDTKYKLYNNLSSVYSWRWRENFKIWSLMMCLSLLLQGFSFKRASSLYRSHNASSASRGLSDERRPQLVKSCSVAPGWQPWMPVPSCEPAIMDTEDDDSAFSSVPTLPSLSSSSTSSSTSSSSNSLSTPNPCPSMPPAASGSGLGILTASGDVASGRRRHRSQPQPHTSCSFPFSLDDDGIRTTDV